jgi:hypothetical protein
VVEGGDEVKLVAQLEVKNMNRSSNLRLGKKGVFIPPRNRAVGEETGAEILV